MSGDGNRQEKLRHELAEIEAEHRLVMKKLKKLVSRHRVITDKVRVIPLIGKAAWAYIRTDSLEPVTVEEICRTRARVSDATGRGWAVPLEDVWPEPIPLEGKQ